MYASTQNRAVSAIASAAIVAGIGAMLLMGLQAGHVAAVAQSLIALDLPPPRPSPTPTPTPPPKAAKSAPKGDPGERNLKNKATQIVAPKPPLVIVPPPPVPVATTPANTGSATQSGASDRPGAGQGAGNYGSGLGGGGAGGDGGGLSLGPRRIRGRLAYGDLPDDIRDRMEEVRLETDAIIQADGHVTDCRVVRSSGYRSVDAMTCDLLERRYFYRAAQDARGTPVSVHWQQRHFFIPDDRPR
ncbi:MAG TPA: energy transducer TonB [Novosphingobium sp.]|nr:energy transducer TonB [Novosphingobium sp.]